MILMWLYIVFHLSSCVVHCQHLEWNGTEFSNNSVIYSGDISNGLTALKCFTDNNNCCSPNTGNWINQTGQIANQEPDQDRCLYFTRGDRVMSLNRLRVCTLPLAGLWRCDVPDSSGVIQSLFIFIGSSPTSGQLSNSVTINFTLHTEPRVGPPQFTISCQTHGGPATAVSWDWNRRQRLTKIVTESKYVILMEGSRNHSVYIETSQTILDTSDLSVYDNKLLVRGRVGGEFACSIRNTFYSLPRTNKTTITVAGKPSRLTGVISSSNNTHVNIIVSWESPTDTVTTGYVIYYQPKTGGPVISESVTGGHRESHSLTGLQRGHTYNICTVALSQHLPSPLVGPVNVATGPLLVVKTSPQSLNVTSNEPFSLNCTVRAEHEGNPVNTIIQWIRTNPSSDNAPGMKTVLEGPSVFDNSSKPQYGSGISSSILDPFLTSTVLDYQVVEVAIESGTFIYRCEATALNTTSFGDSTVFVKEVPVFTSQIISTSQIIISSSSTQTSPAPTATTASEDSYNNSTRTITTANMSSKPPTITSSTSSLNVSNSAFSKIITTKVSGKMSSSTVTDEITDPSTNNDKSKPGRKWVFVTSAVTGVVITVILICFLVFIVLFKRTDRRKKDQQPLSQTLQPFEMKPVDMRYGVYDRMSAGRGSEVEEDISDVPVVRSDIPVSDFPHYVLDMADETRHTESKLAIEYLQLQNNYTSTYDVAYLPQNIDLNRFRNIYPYDDSRVPLTEIPGEPGSDYINASSISGYHGSRYIAAQAPLIETIHHFWRMIWEYGVETIVMLTRCVELSREKCVQYWPESLNENITPGDRISVTLLASTPYAEYHIRKFLVKHLVEKSKPMTVTQFHYTAWPDHGVPDNVMAIIRFIRHVRKLFPASQDPPLLVHCSAGVGRTGTFITLDMMMQQMRTEGTLSVCQCVKHIRTQRMKMVQTLAQYEFIHYALSELVMCGETEIVAANLRSFTDLLNHDSQPSISQQHMNTLDYLCTQQKCDFTGAKNEANVNKNRFKNKPPNDIYRVPLHSSSDTDSEYINASVINGYKQKNAYIATQGPLKETVEDFWRMMWEYRCGCIVMLCQLEEDGQESSYCYWPGEEGEQMVSGRLKVRLVKVRGHGDILERKLEVTGSDSFSTDILTVKMIQLTSWPLQELPHPAGIMSLIEKLNDVLMRSSSKQTVVMCSDGVVRSGTFLCIHSQLERLKTEGTVDVFQAIRSARIQRPGVVPNTDHYVFCYEVLADYVEKMEAYHNFKTLM